MAFQTVRNSANARGLQLRNPCGEKTPAFVYPAPGETWFCFLTAGSVWKSAGAESTKGCRAGYRLGLTAGTYRRLPSVPLPAKEGNVTRERQSGLLDPLVSELSQVAKSCHVEKVSKLAVACCHGDVSPV
jgi:hypothetical protein